MGLQYVLLHGSFRKLGVPYLGVLIIRTLLFRVLYLDPLFSETPRHGPAGLCSNPGPENSGFYELT